VKPEAFKNVEALKKSVVGSVKLIILMHALDQPKFVQILLRQLGQKFLDRTFSKPNELMHVL